MVEPKLGHDSELVNQDKKQEVKEGMAWEITLPFYFIHYKMDSRKV